MIPHIDLSKCTHCQLCIMDCVANAISQEKKEILEGRCILCGHCCAICPEEAITINGKAGERIIPVPLNFPDHFETLIKKRRSIRNYKQKEISKGLIQQIVGTTNHCPTGTNSRKVEITIIDKREKISHLSDIIMNHFDKLTKWLINPFTYLILVLLFGKKRTKKLFQYRRLILSYEKNKNILTYDAPLLMIFHADKKSSTPGQDAVIWATTAMYCAESLGIGTCFNGFLVIGINTCKKARQYLKIPRGHKIYESFTAGYSKYSYKRTINREDLRVNYI